MAATWVIGDVHGQLDALERLLRSIGVADDAGRWSGGDATVWFVGDFVDRGPSGIDVVETVMRLQDEAAASDGRVASVLGNHDAMLVAAHRFGDTRLRRLRMSLADLWRRNGGRDSDLERLTERHVDWLLSLPALARVGDDLLVHADAIFYIEYGWSIDEVNERVRRLLGSDDIVEWGRFLQAFAERNSFADPENARRFLKVFGGSRIVHGHTPIPFVADVPAERVTEPLVYGNGTCVNVDGGMYAGGPGIALRLDALPA